MTPSILLFFHPQICSFKGHNSPYTSSWGGISDMIPGTGSTNPFVRHRRMGCACWSSNGLQREACLPAFCLNSPQLGSPHEPRCQTADSCLQAAPSASTGISPGIYLVGSFRLALRSAMWGGSCWETVWLFSTLGSSFPIIYQSQHWIRFLSLKTVIDSRVLLNNNLAKRKTAQSALLTVWLS